MIKVQNILFATALASVTALTGCENKDIDFPDYEGGVSVYFSYQTPVRTLILGSDTYDDAVALDHQHKCKIMATMGGAYKGRNIVANIQVDPSLMSRIDASQYEVMPTDYYQLAGNQIHFNGNPRGGVEVQLTDAFFADPKSITTHYVIPVVMTSQTGGGRIITGTPAVAGSTPDRIASEEWEVLPQDFTLMAIKYVNKYHGYWLHLATRSLNNAQTMNTYGTEINQNTPRVNLNTVSLNQATYEVDLGSEKCTLVLTFDGSDNCQITCDDSNFEVSGSGKFTSKGAKLAWGEKDRDLIELNYSIKSATNTLTSKDYLVWQRHGVVMPEEFKYELKN